MKARMNELGLHAADLAGIAGSGAAGRVTIEDLEIFSPASRSTSSAASSMRVAVADAMRRRWTRPLATVGRPVRLDAMLAHRKSSDPKAGPALYALRALAVRARRKQRARRPIGWRQNRASPDAIDVGFAVEAEDGVLVPVLRKADKRRCKEIVERYNELVELARQRRLPAGAQGDPSPRNQFRHLRSRLGHTDPAARANARPRHGRRSHRARSGTLQRQGFVPATEWQLTLSFDHRVLDGGAAGRLLARIEILLQTPAAL